jgi:hypothetical protein
MEEVRLPVECLRVVGDEAGQTVGHPEVADGEGGVDERSGGQGRHPREVREELAEVATEHRHLRVVESRSSRSHPLPRHGTT